MVNGWSFFDLAWPACQACGLATASRKGLCPGCREDMPWLAPGCRTCALPLPAGSDHDRCLQCMADPPPVTRAVAALAYEFPVDRFVQRLKFDGRLPLASLLADLLHTRIGNASDDDPLPMALVPVPLHRRRQRQRGFNQAERIAAHIGRRLQLPVLSNAVHRIRHTDAQSGIDLQARHHNLTGAFVATNRPLPAHVAIVDDVATSGSTLRAVAAALAEAGVSRIDSWVVARTL